MKYIRTKDGRIVKPKAHRFYKYVLEGEKLYLSGKRRFLYINNVVSQADTIEELCDEYIVISGNTESVMYQTKDYLIFRNLRNEDYRNHKTIHNVYYGAIWTYDSNGAPTLKPVARMKDKGELELL